MSAFLYDAHNHLQLEPLGQRASELAGALGRLRVRNVVVNGTCEADWPKVEALALRHSMIIPAFGVHPWHAATASDHWQEELSRLLDRFPFCAGEIGLDRWMENPDIQKQKDVFVRHLREARTRGIPAAIHCLKAWGALLEVLEAEQPFPGGFLLHSYGGSAELVEPLAKLGAYFSISGYFAHPRKERQRSVFRAIPLDRLLVETDAPDMLPPKELRVRELVCGEKEANHPANIVAVYNFAAELRGMPLEEFAGRVENNFRRLFKSFFATENQRRNSS